MEETKIDPDDDKPGDRFGDAVPIDGGTVVVGAPFADPNLGNGQIINGGAVYVFTKKVNAWRQSAKIVQANGRYLDHFGQSVSVDQKTIVIGTPGYDYYNKPDSGAAHLFKLVKREWVNQTRVVLSNLDHLDKYGTSVALVRDWIVVGLPDHTTQSGTIYIYVIKAGVLPETGFAPDAQLTALNYKQHKSLKGELLWLNIPSLAVEARIVGVLREGNEWDVRGLCKDVGYLESTAYPLWNGNTIIAGHVSLPGGNPGPFSDIYKLKWGDQIIIHAYGNANTYEVREILQTMPHDLKIIDRSDNYDWLTLVTCSQYDPDINLYKSRIVVVSVRVE